MSGGESVKLKPIDKQFKFQSNHRWVSCNFPLKKNVYTYVLQIIIWQKGSNTWLDDIGVI